MLGLPEPDEYEIAVCGYTSDLGGKNLQSEWYAIKVPNPYPDPSSYPYSDYPHLIGGRQIVLPSSAKEKEKVKINPPSAKANEKVTIETEPLHPFSVVRMMYQSTQHAFVDPSPVVPFGFGNPSRLYSLGGLDPVGSDSDGDGAHPFESERYRKVWSLDVNKPDAGWEAVPPMNFPNRYNAQSVAYLGKLYVLGGFSRSQFPAEAAAKGVGWMEAYDPFLGWELLPNPPSGFSFNDDPLIFTTFKEMILLAQYNHDDMNCDSVTFYAYNLMWKDWRTLPLVRRLLARYPDRTGRRSVAVDYTLYWGLFEGEDINVQAYDVKKDIWFHGSFNIRHVLEKDEFLADDVFPASPPLLHLADQKFCLFLLSSIYDEKNCEDSNLYLNCLILDVFPINDEGDNHQHDYYDHVCYKVRGDVNVDDKEDNANYCVHPHPHNHFWRLSISIASIQKYPLVNPIQLWDAVVL